MDPAPQERGALLTALTTEHFTLQGARAATITESLGRSTIYLGSLSASLVAFALIAQGESVADFRFFALLILPGLFFLGTVTFVRIVETGIEDATYAQAINRTAATTSSWRARTRVTSRSAVMTTWRACSPTWESPPPAGDRSFSVASVIALINSMVAGALVGVALDAFSRRSIALIVGIVVALIALVVHYRLGSSRFARALERFTPIFPSSADRPGLPSAGVGVGSYLPITRARACARE
jgi:hypothetical protein